MKFLKFTLIAFFLVSFLGVKAQEEQKEQQKPKTVFMIDADYKTRFENTPSALGAGKLVPVNTPTANTLGQRARIILKFNSPKLQTKISFQDVRMFGQNKNTGTVWGSTDGAALAIHEAWAKYMFVNNDKKQFGIKLGRQEFKYDARLMWNKNWKFQGAAYDGVMLECDNKDFGLKWNLGFAYNSVDYMGTADFFRTLGVFNVTKSFDKLAKINLINLYEGFEQDQVLANGTQDSTYFRNTVGINPIITVSGLKFDAGFYYQMGKSADLQGSTAAMLYSANLSYKIDLGNKKTVNVGAGYDSYSGRAYDDVSDADVNKAFTSPYAGAHKYFGNTDFQLKMFGKGHGANDINLKLTGKIKTTSITLAAHMISFAETAAYTNATGANVEFTTVGNNIDLVVKHGLGKKMAVLAGYSMMMPSDDYTTYTLGYDGTNAVEAKTHNYIWVMFSFEPNLFKSVK